MNADWVKFLLIAVVAMAVCLGGIGGWLLPQLGLEEAAGAGDRRRHRRRALSPFSIMKMIEEGPSGA